MDQIPFVDRKVPSSGGVRSSFFEGVVPLLAKAAKTAVELHHQWGGSTVSVIGGNMSGQQFYAVGTYPGRSVECATKPSWEQIFAFAVVNAHLLFLSNHALGTWFNQLRNSHEIEVVRCVRDLHEALALGRRFKQHSIYDLERLQEVVIPTSRFRRSRWGWQ